MSGILFDTWIYISALRQGSASLFALRRASHQAPGQTRPVWLSAVVLEELYAGAQDGRMKKLLARLENDFNKMKRILEPLQSDWTVCGQVLALIGKKYGYEEVGRARLTNDTLIAMTAARNGFSVQTKNATDFQRIAEFRPFHWEEV
jgi:predicted nucleic acid-binding protein